MNASASPGATPALALGECGPNGHRGPGGHWRFHYDVSGKTADESGHHFENERFELGEYVSVREADGPHAYRVVAVNAL